MFDYDSDMVEQTFSVNIELNTGSKNDIGINIDVCRPYIITVISSISWYLLL